MSAESKASDPYELVLADLWAKKAQIDQAISAIEAIHGGAISQPASGQSSSSGNDHPNSDIESPGAFLGMSIVDAAKKILEVKRQPLRNPEISAAFKRGGLVLNSKDPVNTIGSVLTRRANEVGDLVKVDRGTWGLKEWYPNRTFKTARPAADVSDAEPAKPSETASEESPEIGPDLREALRALGTEDSVIDDMTAKEAQEWLEALQ